MNPIAVPFIIKSFSSSGINSVIGIKSTTISDTYELLSGMVSESGFCGTVQPININDRITKLNFFMIKSLSI